MDMETSPSLDFDRICRVCLLEYPAMTDIFIQEKGVVPLSMRFMSCTYLEVTRTDKLPQKLCSSCLFQIDSWYKFKDLSESSEKVLNKIAVNGEVDFGSVFQIQSVGREIKDKFAPVQPNFVEKDKKGDRGADTISKGKVGFSECNFCLKYFSDQSLAAHKVRSHGREMKKQQRTINKSIKLKTRVKIVDGSKLSEEITGEVKCSVCDAEFIAKGELVEHVLSEHGVAGQGARKEVNHDEEISLFLTTDDTSGHCDECGMECPNESELLIHKYMDHRLEKHSQQEQQCIDCLIMFPSTKTLYEHISEQHGYRCRDCNNGYATKEELARHLTKSGDHKIRYPCTHCSLVFEEEDEMLKHVKQKTECQICNKVCSKPQHLTEHMLAKHNIGIKDKKKHQCNICGKEFPYSTSLKFHMRTHGEKHIACSICGRSFHFMCNYKVHMDLHHSAPEDKVVCELCGGLFPKCKIRDHLLRHSAPAFACQFCGKKFRLNGHLRRHLSKYHDTRHECPMCLKTFSTMEEVQVHIETEHQDFTVKVELESIAS